MTKHDEDTITLLPEFTATQPTRLITYAEVKRRYTKAKTIFRIAKAHYETCRSWCSKGGTWPSRTREAKLAMHKRARSCRHWQVLYEGLRAKRQAAIQD